MCFLNGIKTIRADDHITKLDIDQGEHVHGPVVVVNQRYYHCLLASQCLQGNIELLGKAINQLSNSKRDRFRADHIGYIFQNFNLLPYLSH